MPILKRTKLTHDAALNLVIDFIREQGYQGEIVPLEIGTGWQKIGIALIKPYGLFIVHETGRVEDNYFPDGRLTSEDWQ